MREAAWWSGFDIAVRLGFGAVVWTRAGVEVGGQYLAGSLVEKSLSVDSLSVFMLLLEALAVPAAVQKRVAAENAEERVLAQHWSGPDRFLPTFGLVAAGAGANA